ncbi:MAG: PEP/pyruvate-binding domain-containing protein [Bacillota bacterium]
MVNGTDYFLTWPEAFKAGAASVGGKGWNLGRLERYGFNIPPGGVLSAAAYRDFIEYNNLGEDADTILPTVTLENVGTSETEEKLARFRERIKDGHIPPRVQAELLSKLNETGILERPVAVRSSATAEDSGEASFAGIHESFLNVQGPDNILMAVKGCYASLWTPRAVAYRRKMNIPDGRVMAAVVIMAMVEAKAAGIAFSCDPRTGREDIILINANYGLGESVVSGSVEPDEYRLDLNAAITGKRIGRKEGITVTGKDGGTEFVKPGDLPGGQVLPDENISKLGLLTLRVYEALGRGEEHQDIEWVFDGNGFILVQARPVTALPRYTCAEIKHQPDMWSNANFRDAVPMVLSSLCWSRAKPFLNLFYHIPFQMVDYKLPAGLQFLKLFHGRAYQNLSLFQWFWYDVFGVTPRETNAALGGHQPEIRINEKKPFAGIKGIRRRGRVLKLFLAVSRLRGKAEKIINAFSDMANSLSKKDFKVFKDREFFEAINNFESVYFQFATIFCASLFFTGPVGMMVKTLEKYFPGRGNALANGLMAGSADITSAQHGYRLLEMAEIARGDADARRYFSSEPFAPLLWEKELPDNSRFKQSFKSFLEEYGHRGVYELDIINPRWREDPSYLLNVVRSTMETADLGKIKARQKEKVAGAWREINRVMPFYRRIWVKYWLKKSLKGVEMREMCKSVFVKLFEPERMMFLEIGRHLAERCIIKEQADIFHCTLTEIKSILQGDWDGKGLAVLVSDRKDRRKEMEALSPPDLIIEDVPQTVRPVASTAGNVLTGLGVAAGSASGTARLIYHPHEGGKLSDGDVLVAPSTDPAWTPLFLKTSAIVMETGGFLSHGAIVAREYCVPAVVNIPGVLKIIKDEQIITVDGDEGKIYL